MGIDPIVLAAERDNMEALLATVGGYCPQLVLDMLQWADRTELFSAKECYRRILHCRLHFFSDGVMFFN